MGDEKLCTTLKAAALIGLVENGIIQPEENGDIDTENFERFWCYFERQMDTVIYDRMSAERQKVCREERQRRESRGLLASYLIDPTPTVYAPTPTVYAPTPTVYAPTPTVYAPTPTVYVPPAKRPEAPKEPDKPEESVEPLDRLAVTLHDECGISWKTIQHCYNALFVLLGFLLGAMLPT